MKRSSYFTLLMFAMGLASMFMHRDISANVFMSTVFVIQALKPANETSYELSKDRAALLCTLLSVAIIGLVIYGYVTGVELRRPRSW